MNERKSPCFEGSCTHLLRPIGSRYKAPETSPTGGKFNVTYEVTAHGLHTSPMDDKEGVWKEDIKVVKRERMESDKKK